jgi:D-sedoheptulose 7-phosphate isomerase
MGRFEREREALAAIALTTDTSVLTAVGNDFGFEQVFARQIDALGREGDVALALSTSGDSANVMAGVEAARRRALDVVGFTGKSGGRLAGACDVVLRVPSGRVARIQEGHILLGHVVCELVEAALAEP